MALQNGTGSRKRAVAAGFQLAGIADVPDDTTLDDARFTAFVEAGHAGEMEYLKRADDAGDYVRGDLRRSMPWARSVIVCAVNYNADAPLSIEPARLQGRMDSALCMERPRRRWPVATTTMSYCRSCAMSKQKIKERFAGCETRCYVDTGPIVERGFAARAGVGWIAKNTCVINQQQGSWLLLGVIITSLELAPETLSVAAADRCGTCTRCVDACPTDALFGDRTMDASRCIAYLTIEKKGSIDESLRPLMGRQVFGCDICQDVCPWNRKAPIAISKDLPMRKELVNPALQWLAAMDGSQFNRVFRGSPLERTRRKRVLRNLAIAMGNSGSPDFLRQLDHWTAGDDPILAEAAAWAAARLRNSAPSPT